MREEKLKPIPLNKNQVMEKFKLAVRAWLAAMPGRAGEIRGAVCEKLELRAAEFDAWVGVAVEVERAVEGSPEPPFLPQPQLERGKSALRLWENQPEPLGAKPKGLDARPLLTNFRWEERWVADAKAVKDAGVDGEKELIEFRLLAKRSRVEDLSGGEAERFEDLKRRWKASVKAVQVALNSDEVERVVVEGLKGWPMKMSDTWLFVDDCREDGSVRMIEDAEQFKALLHDYFRVSLESGLDVDRVNYVSHVTLYCNIKSSARNWKIVEKYPHYPAFKGHYYTWRGDETYEPTGEYMAKFLEYFYNIEDSVSRAIFAGATLTMFSGILYGKRPLFIHDADLPGSGKSSAAVAIGKLAGDMVMTGIDRKSEEQLLTRLLSPLGMELRGILWDNVDTVFKSSLACQIITADPDISAHRMREGEGRRPANLVCFASLNSARVDSDIGRRCFFTYFKKPDVGNEQITKWGNELNAFIHNNLKRIQADCVHILSRPTEPVDWRGAKGETFSDWMENVLAPGLSHPLVLRAVMNHEKLDGQDDVTVLDVFNETRRRRDERNMDIEEALSFMEGLCERVVEWQKLRGSATQLPGVKGDVFIRSGAPSAERDEDQWGVVRKISTDAHENMTDYWNQIFDQSLSMKTVTAQLNKHIAAGRMKGLRRGKSKDCKTRGFWLSEGVLVNWLDLNREVKTD